MTFNLEKRAKELLCARYGYGSVDRNRAIQLACEALEAAAKEHEKKAGKTIAGVYAEWPRDAAAINRRIAKTGADRPGHNDVSAAIRDAMLLGCGVAAIEANHGQIYDASARFSGGWGELDSYAKKVAEEVIRTRHVGTTAKPKACVGGHHSVPIGSSATAAFPGEHDGCTFVGTGHPYRQDTMSHEKPGASPHPSGDSSDEAADNLGSRTAERTSQPPAPLSDAGFQPDMSIHVAGYDKDGKPKLEVHPVMPDAEILERSAKLLDRANLEGGLICTSLAAKLRAAEEPDVFDAFGSVYGEREMEDHAREWFAPLVSALERTFDRLGDYEFPPERIRHDIAETLSALRARARAQGGGR